MDELDWSDLKTFGMNWSYQPTSVVDLTNALVAKWRQIPAANNMFNSHLTVHILLATQSVLVYIPSSPNLISSVDTVPEAAVCAAVVLD